MAPRANHRSPPPDGRSPPCIRGVRVTVSAVVGQLAAGRTIDACSLTTPALNAKAKTSWPRSSTRPPQ